MHKARLLSFGAGESHLRAAFNATGIPALKWIQFQHAISCRITASIADRTIWEQQIYTHQRSVLSFAFSKRATAVFKVSLRWRPPCLIWLIDL
jgi:hypothetical protein